MVIEKLPRYFSQDKSVEQKQKPTFFTVNQYDDKLTTKINVSQQQQWDAIQLFWLLQLDMTADKRVKSDNHIAF